MKKIKIKNDGVRINRLVEEATLVNLLPNPSLESDSSWISSDGGFTYDTTQHLFGDRCVKFEKSSSLTRIMNCDPINIELNHKYYARRYIKTDGNAAAIDCRFEIFGGDGDGKNWVFAVNTGNFPEWTMHSSIHLIHMKAASSYYFRSFAVRPSNNIYLDGYMLIDLTACFGAGAEPSKDWCDKHIPFFEGTTVIAMPMSISEYKITCGNFIEQSNLPVAMRIKDGQMIVKKIYEGENAELNLAINNFTIPRLTVQKAMTPIQLSANLSGVTWSIILGSLPPGVSLSPSGRISGTPTRPGTFYILFGCTYRDRTVTKGVTITCGEKVCTVTFNANGGSCSVRTLEVMKYSLLGTLPVPKLEGQIFGGWFTAATGGLPVDESYTVIDDITLYARYGANVNVQFGAATTQFKIQYMGDRTNFANNPYTLYARRKGATADTIDLTFQTGIQSTSGNSNDITNVNPRVTLFLKVTNNGEAGYFDIGYLCDSYIAGNDACHLMRINQGVRVGNLITATVPSSYKTSIWVGRHGQQSANKYVNQAIGSEWGTGSANPSDSGYTFTINDVFINSNSYTILEVTFQKI